MKQADRIILEKMIGYCDDILSTMERLGASKESYQQDKVYQYAVGMCILQIGELTARLSDEAKQETAQIPWRLIRAMRNVFAHNYEKAEHELIWQTISEDIPIFRKQLQEALQCGKASPPSP